MIILASKSASRRAMLDAAGVQHTCVPADIDERAIEQELSGSKPAQIAEALSIAKAKAIASKNAGELVLGSDSLVVVDAKRYDKPQSRDNAAEHLRAFSGRVMELHSAAALVRNDGCVWHHSSLARLHVRPISEDFIEQYLASEWPEISYCAGAFRIEAMGAQLFEHIEGDQFTVLGMPLLQVLAALRDEGELIV